jgi:hypothetical protein
VRCDLARIQFSSRRGCGDDSELLEHQESVEHQVERDVLAIAEVEHLNVVHPDGVAGWRDVAHRAVKHAVVSPRERALLNREIIDEVNTATCASGKASNQLP